MVATLVTEDADLACRKNNLTFEQLVRYILSTISGAMCISVSTSTYLIRSPS